MGLINTFVLVFTFAEGVPEIPRIALAGNASDGVHAQVVWQWANNRRLFIALINIETFKIERPAADGVEAGITNAAHDATW